MDQRTVENIVEISFAFISLAKSKMLRLPDDGTASAILKEEIISCSEEFEAGYEETGNYLENIRGFAYGKFEEKGWLLANTRITYLYRDASNYKRWNECVVKGRITAGQVHEILSCCNEGMYFIPSQVGMPEEKFSEETEDDHCWFEIGEGSFAMTLQPPTEGITVDELIQMFRDCKGKWKDWI